MTQLETGQLPITALVLDPDPYSAAGLAGVLGRLHRVDGVVTAGTLEDARRHLQSKPINTVFVDPLAIGLNDASAFIFGMRVAFPKIVFVLYHDHKTAEYRADFYAGERRRFHHYFVLDKQTPFILFGEQAVAVVRMVRADLEWSLSAEELAGVLSRVTTTVPDRSGQPLSRPDRAEAREIFGINLAALRRRLLSTGANPELRVVGPNLLDLLSTIDQLGTIEPEAGIARARKVTEEVITPLHTKHLGPSNKPLFEQIEALHTNKHIPKNVYSYLNTVRTVGNLSVHYQPKDLVRMTASDLKLIGFITAVIIEWYITSADA